MSECERGPASRPPSRPTSCPGHMDWRRPLSLPPQVGRLGPEWAGRPVVVSIAQTTSRELWQTATARPANALFGHEYNSTLTEFLLAGESVMCAPSVIQTALAGLSRRELLQVAASLAAATACAPPTLNAADEPTVRS